MTANPGQKKALREAAVDVVRRLQEAGHAAYFAGGCVRDRLLGQEPEDYDIATEAHPDVVADMFRGTRRVGESFGVMLVRSHGHVIQVATFRSEGAYSDHRHPDEVIFSDEHEDAARRDFTINGLFEDPLTDQIIDHVGGQADLEAGTIRAIGDADERFEEDHLRILRAVRFATRFGFDIEARTAQAITSHVGNLKGVSAERIGQEFRRMAAKGRWGPAMRLICSLGLEEALLGHAGQEGDWLRCDHQDLCDPPPAAHRFEPAMAAWLLDRVEGDVDEACCESVADRLVFSNQERARLGAIISVHERVNAEWDAASVATCKRLASSEVFQLSIELIRAVDTEWADSIEARVEVLAETDLAPDPLVSGGDLLEAGLAAGQEMGEILDKIYDAQLEGGLPDRESAIELAKKLSSQDHEGR